MKTKKLLTFAAATLMLAACNNENNESGPVPLRINSGIEAQTRASTAGIQDTQIGAGESVVVWVRKASADATVVYNSNVLTANGSGGFTGGTAMFFPQDGGGVNIYAIHSKPSIAQNETRIISKTCEVHTDQSVPSNIANSDLLFATKKGATYATPNVPLTFYHMLAKVKIGIKIGTGSPVLASSAAVKMNGVMVKCNFVPNYDADMTNASARSSMIVPLGTETGTVTASQNTTTDFTVYNDIILPPQNLAGKKLSITLSDGGVLYYTFPAGSLLNSGKKYLYNITLDLTGLTVTSAISDWEAVNAVSGNAVLE